MGISAKLHSRKGASVIIALVFTLLCMFVAAVILTAATANVGRLSHLRKAEQDYLDVSSTAGFVRDVFAANDSGTPPTFTGVKTTKTTGNTPGAPAYTMTLAGVAGSLGGGSTNSNPQGVKAWVLHVYRPDTYPLGYNSNIRYSFADRPDDAVYANATIEENDQSNAYSITFDFYKLSDPGDPNSKICPLRLHIPATVRVKTNTVLSGNVKTETETTTVTWEAGVISKQREVAP